MFWLCLLVIAFLFVVYCGFGFGFGCCLYLSELCVVCFGFRVVGYLIHAYDLWLVGVVVLCSV